VVTDPKGGPAVPTGTCNVTAEMSGQEASLANVHLGVDQR
jgi:hypothetical protein